MFVLMVKVFLHFSTYFYMVKTCPNWQSVNILTDANSYVWSTKMADLLLQNNTILCSNNSINTISVDMPSASLEVWRPVFRNSLYLVHVLIQIILGWVIEDLILFVQLVSVSFWLHRFVIRCWYTVT